MTISSETRKTSAFTSGTALPFTFKIFDTSEAYVVEQDTVTGIETLLVETTDYTVALNADQNSNPGGTVTLLSTIVSGTQVVVSSLVLYKQSTHLKNQGGFYPEVINDALDKITILSQQLKEEIDRSLKFPISDPALEETIPAQVLRKGTVLAFNETTGEPEVGPDIVSIATVYANIANINTVANNIAEVSSVGSMTADLAILAALEDELVSLSALIGGAAPILAAKSELIFLLHPNQTDGWNSIYRAGLKPWGFNQQNGGANWGGSPDGNVIESYASCQLPSDGGLFNTLGYNTTILNISVPFRPTETTVNTVYLQVEKVGNPTNNLVAEIFADSAGAPTGTALGTSDSISGKTISTSRTWVKFTFSTPVTGLTPNTRYHVSVKIDATDSTTNYYNIPYQTTSLASEVGTYRYPTGGPWTSVNAAGSHPHLIVNDNGLLQTDTTSDVSDAKIVFGQGTPLNQSKAFTADLKDFFSHKEGSILIRGKLFEDSKPIFDAILGQDNNRITLRTGASGEAILTVYDNAEVLREIDTADAGSHDGVGVTSYDLSGTGPWDIGISYKSRGVATDYIKVDIFDVTNGTTETYTNTIGGSGITFDQAFKDQGTLWIGGGFELAPTWANNAMTDGTQLPSHANNGTWTFTGGSESAKMSMADSKLYQNAAGYSSASGYYIKSGSLGLDFNAGLTIETKLQILNDSETSTASECRIVVDDFTNYRFTIAFYTGSFRYFDGTSNFTFPYDFKTNPVAINIEVKGSDILMFCDGTLVYDGTGKLLLAGSVELISFGDEALGAGDDADVIWHYFKYFNHTSTTLLEFSDGAELHELGVWQGDASSVFQHMRYGASNRVSIKDFWGVKDNIVKRIKRINRYGLDSATNTTSSSTTENTALDVLSVFSLQSNDICSASFNVNLYNTVIAKIIFAIIRRNGVTYDSARVAIEEHTSSYINPGALDIKKDGIIGLANFTVAMWSTGANVGMHATGRNLQIEQ